MYADWTRIFERLESITSEFGYYGLREDQGRTTRCKILLDVSMPEMDAITALHELQQDGAHSGNHADPCIREKDRLIYGEMGAHYELSGWHRSEGNFDDFFKVK